MPWAYFQNQAAWDTFHNAACTDQGIPRPGKNAATQAVAVMECWTDAYVNPIQLKGQGNVTTWAAQISQADATKYAGALGTVIPDNQVVLNYDPVTRVLTSVTVQGTTYTVDPVTLTWRKAKPATVTVDGVKYDTKTGAVIP